MEFHQKFWRNLQEVENTLLNLVSNKGVSKIITERNLKRISHWQDHSSITLYDYPDE